MSPPARKPSPRARGLETDEIVQALVADPREVPSLIVLQGLLGESTRGGCHRVYTHLDLSAYVDVPSDCIKLVRPMEHGEASTIWIDRSAQLVHVDQRVTQAGAEYLHGSIVRCVPPPCEPPPPPRPTWTSAHDPWGGGAGGPEPSQTCWKCRTQL